MSSKPRRNPRPSVARGFTLVEISIVILIMVLLISAIASVVSRGALKGRDAAVRNNVNAMAELLELEKAASGSYAQLEWGWSNSAADCNAKTSSSGYAAQAKIVCIDAVKASTRPGAYLLYIGNQGNSSYRYSVMGLLPSTNTYYCRGNSGLTSDNTPNDGSYAGWANPGCYANP